VPPRNEFSPFTWGRKASGFRLSLVRCCPVREFSFSAPGIFEREVDKTMDDTDLDQLDVLEKYGRLGQLRSRRRGAVRGVFTGFAPSPSNYHHAREQEQLQRRLAEASAVSVPDARVPSDRARMVELERREFLKLAAQYHRSRV